MAYCPKCKGEMDSAALACPHCGYNFPDPSSAAAPRKTGFAYSPLADLALLVCMIAAVIGAGGAGFATIWAIWKGDFIIGFFWGPIATLLQLGMFVVFLRVQQ
jgi:hypothetical protein